ncbi:MULTISPECIES: hypothetical protein [unclassified Streptomyces]|uniref:hypothetical protein n=1 Tax=unclassified Streptomyces TaxID=2593676 RepID=UPI0029A3FDA9|nr:hypothetical protein [Streptomyces sp. DK15]MDX2389259.1 hypothetical protein [Streptomyces sp. DK15]
MAAGSTWRRDILVGRTQRIDGNVAIDGPDPALLGDVLAVISLYVTRVRRSKISQLGRKHASGTVLAQAPPQHGWSQDSRPRTEILALPAGPHRQTLPDPG